MEVVMPTNFNARAGLPERNEWTVALPDVLEHLRELWHLDIAQPFQPGGETAWVAPVKSQEFGDVVLKIAWKHDEARDEAKGLQNWSGHGAVELLDVADINESTAAMLLERCLPGTPLSSQSEMYQDEVVAGLLRRLWEVKPSNGSYRPLVEMCDAWADECEQKLAARPVDIREELVRAGVEQFRALPRDADREVLLCTDLHAGNVLAAQREPWLMIDPKPYCGDPTYDALQHLLNCEERLVADPLGIVSRMSDLCGLYRDRLGRWLFARCIIESPHWPAMAEVARRIGSHFVD